jgi:hypothetical protein
VCAAPHAVERGEQPGRQDLLPEVPAVESAAQDRLVDRVQLDTVNAAGSSVYTRFVYWSFARSRATAVCTTAA